MLVAPKIPNVFFFDTPLRHKKVIENHEIVTFLNEPVPSKRQPLQLPYVGTTVRSECRSQKVQVARGIRWPRECCAQLDQLRYNDPGSKFGVTAKGNNRYRTWNGAYKGSLNVGAETKGDDDIEKNLQKMIPDGWIGRFFLDAPFNSPHNRLDDRETFIEF